MAKGPCKQSAVSDWPNVYFADRKITLGGVIWRREQAEEIIAAITALMPFLDESRATGQTKVQEQA